MATLPVRPRAALAARCASHWEIVRVTDPGRGLADVGRDDEETGHEVLVPPHNGHGMVAINISVMKVSESENPREHLEEYVIPYMLGVVLRFSQITLLAPVRLRRAYDRWAVVKIYPGLVMLQRLLVFACGVLVIPTVLYHILNKDIFIGIFICSNVLLPMWPYSLAVLNSPGKLQRHITLLRQIQKINENFKCTNAKKDRQLKTWFIYVYIVCVYVIPAIVLMNENSIPLQSPVWAIVSYQHFVVFLQLLQLSLIINEMMSTLIIINDELQSWLECFTKVHPRASICYLSDCYGEICDLVEKINEDNGTFLLIQIVLIFTDLLLTCHNFLTAVDSNDLIGMVRQVAWCLFHLSQLLILVEPNHGLNEQQQRTRCILCKLAGELGLSGRDVAHLEPFLLQVQMRNAAVVPLGMFHIARPLVASVIGGVSTSLIIIVQFRKMSEHV
ncbi:uncharacterized protein LOC125226532 [Leguminivora glycinivorella]|uniref:uncharacterized protein LOC125226532 n=1 Tax=Leguminivora glycinivorella TaxID=1035111 RepID=UPI00200ECF2F|nr:uncharacterized protein LOC125226532 [Leguminivora glycinivorella]